MLCLCRSDLSGRLCQVSEWGGEQHHPPWEAGPERRHDPSPLPLFHQLLTQHIPHRYAHTARHKSEVCLVCKLCLSLCLHSHTTTQLDFTPDWLHMCVLYSCTREQITRSFRDTIVVARVNTPDFIPRRSVNQTRRCIWGSLSCVTSQEVIQSSHAMRLNSLVFMS